MARVALLLATVVAVGVLAAACGNSETRSASPDTVSGAAPADTGGTEGASGGGGETAAAEGDPAAGEAIFASAGCGGCHTLAAAGAAGNVGPNLDEAKPSYDLVVSRVTNGMGAMPSFSGQLSEDDIKNVAAYVVQATSG